jgi:hypothetical protein
LDGPISLKAVAIPEQQSKREAPKDRSSANQPRSSQDQIGTKSVSSANGEAKPDAERKSEEVAAKKDRIPEVKAETKTEAGTNSRRPPNRTIQFL